MHQHLRLDDTPPLVVAPLSAKDTVGSVSARQGKVSPIVAVTWTGLRAMGEASVSVPELKRSKRRWCQHNFRRRIRPTEEVLPATQATLQITVPSQDLPIESSLDATSAPPFAKAMVTSVRTHQRVVAPTVEFTRTGLHATANLFAQTVTMETMHMNRS